MHKLELDSGDRSFLSSALVRITWLLVSLIVCFLLVLGLVGARARERADAVLQRIVRSQQPAPPSTVREAMNDAKLAARLSLDRAPDLLLGLLQTRSGHIEQGWRTLLKIAQEEPRNADVVYALVFLSRAVHPDETPKLLRRLRQLDPYAWARSRSGL